MNRIYSLRYSSVARGFIAVSEFARKCNLKSVRRLRLPVLLLTSVLFSAGGFAGTVNNELGYQLFRDFAENKGMFRPGATNIAIYNKQGELVGTLDKAAMPDLSSVNSGSGVATLINPQYIASVKHNGGYTNVSFGDSENRYNIVDRNNATSLDFHAPRLDKLVTEVAPTAVTAQGAVAGAYKDKERYPVFYRLGSGTQYIKNSNGQLTQVGGAYSWLTGGTVGSLSSYQNGEMISTSSGLVFDYQLNGAMPIYGEAGDSGSPLFAFDTVQNKWVLVGVLTAGNGPGGRGNNWAVIPLDFIEQKFNEDNDAPVTFSSSEGGVLEWSFDSSTGVGTLTQGTITYDMHGQLGNDLNAGKNLEFLGQNGQIELKDSVSQGAGSLTFRDNYTVTTSNGSTWTGAGIIVDKEVSVNWLVNGEAGDNLHKIGEGTLTVQGTGINEGGLKVGDGKVVLSQQADSKGQVQAFSSVNIASGRPTVVLTDDRQVNPDTISWGYRGGILDVNGNDLTFHQLKAADYGAVLANNSDNHASITLDFDTEEYLYHGQLKGNVDVTNVVEVGQSAVLVMDGSADISGKFTQENGRLTLQGHPVIHAYNTQSVADKLAASGDHSVLTQPTSFSQEDWENRSFTFDNLSLKNTDFGLGRNATLNTMLEATDSTVTLGDSRVFIDKNDGNGTTFTLEEGTSEAVKDADRSVFNGSAVLNGKTTLDIMNATFNGDISGHASSHVELSSRSHWNMTKSSTLDSFRSKGGTLSLVTDNWSPKTLTVNTLHASSMNIAMGVSTADNTGDRIDILNKATGGHNTLDLSTLFDQTLTLKNDLTLASAPVGTSHGYFSFASLNRGFTVYTPDTQVQEKDGRVYWQLKSHAGTTESQISPGVSDGVTDTTSPVAPDTGNTGSTEADGIVSEGNNSSGVTPSPDSPGENAGTTVNGSTLFKGADNTSLLKKARVMFSAREFILSDSADRWTQVVDNSDADGGVWAMTGYSHGGYDDFSLNQSGLNVGFRQSAASNTWWGMGAEFYRGHSSTDGYRDDFSLWGVHVLAGKSFDGGLFVDGMVGYRELSEDYTIQGELSDLSGRAKSHILTAGIRGGWKMYASPLDMSITPTVSLNGARVDGNRLQGRERSVELHDGDALWLKAGVEAEKLFGNMTLKAGIWRNITFNDMPGMTLRDDWKARHYDAEKADRYTVSFGINGKLTDKLSVQAKVNSSFDGYFKTDAEGILGIRYDF
ncbi:autotransporter outer membrane beta-barrel domain-containing protein [Escherichia coli]|uniref:S6 family peptidase n=1 Tax=Escherichia coli TaxID=562 RepID=UPI0007D9EDDF|nr:S6 family peptidase [Escherichia coli]EKY5862521.1 autotransporter outer membrane beta-barrel domain-containing protein [Escherichia coli O157]EEW8433881.1 autotransporter outer membrane beta-barrel domain-containing protein [Escherichia coli]EEX9412110.1 autotransporter outer membrane beta-barrel domain-containing protein [Escherichia coli]EEY1461561.1 autotransporter outer membrane beta-barrel domain-containing protein [Escherichia coli]EEY3225172.1 autotransporter outer membrane beta-bar